MIDYFISTQQCKAHVFDVKVRLAHPHPCQKVSLASWTPGSYLIRDFARHVITLRAYHEKDSQRYDVGVIKKNSDTWECQNQVEPLVIEYQIYAYDFSVRGAYLDEEQGFINGGALFLKIHEQEQAVHRVSLITPWKCATTLKQITVSSDNKQYESSGYDDLIDHPIQMGNFEEYSFEVCEIPHRLVITGQHDGDVARLIDDVKKICKNQHELFGKPAPFENYLFLLTVRKDAYGGLEHRCSTALQIQREAMPIKGMAEKNQQYINLLALFSHEYFHAWNVKKIKPLCFSPYNLDNKAYTSQLWAFEGITSYYDDLALVRSKVISLEQYLDILSQNVSKLLKTPGRKKQTLIESSFDAWTKFYQPNENSPNAMVSYYLKGSLVSLAFDLCMRVATKHRSSLDDVMQQLWEQYGKTQEGVPECAIEKLIVKAGGASIEPLVQQGLYGTDDLPLSELLAPFGLELTLQEPFCSDDSSKREKVSMQCLFSRINGKITVLTVFEKGAGQEGGLCPNDEIIAMNGLRVDSDNFEKMLRRYAVGQTIELSIFRQDQLRKCMITLQAPNKDSAQITLKKELSMEEKNNLNKWLFYGEDTVS